jgi:GT2 family glycosyltransferase
LQRSVYRFPSLALRLAECTMVERFAPFVFDSYRYFAHDRESEVEFLSGAALMVRADVFKSVGGFDEGFFMYSEESDWMLRASEQGIRALFVPDSVITHLGGQSTNNLSAERSVEFLRSHERLIANHHGAPYMLAYRLATFAKHLPRSIALNITAPGSERALCETDALLWSIGQLKRPGLSEALLGKKV